MAFPLEQILVASDDEVSRMLTCQRYKAVIVNIASRGLDPGRISDKVTELGDRADVLLGYGDVDPLSQPRLFGQNVGDLCEQLRGIRADRRQRSPDWSRLSAGLATDDEVVIVAEAIGASFVAAWFDRLEHRFLDDVRIGVSQCRDGGSDAR